MRRLLLLAAATCALSAQAAVVEDCLLVDENNTHVTEATVSCADGVAEVSVVSDTGATFIEKQKLNTEWRPSRVAFPDIEIKPLTRTHEVRWIGTVNNYNNRHPADQQFACNSVFFPLNDGFGVTDNIQNWSATRYGTINPSEGTLYHSFNSWSGDPNNKWARYNEEQIFVPVDVNLVRCYAHRLEGETNFTYSWDSLVNLGLDDHKWFTLFFHDGSNKNPVSEISPFERVKFDNPGKYVGDFSTVPFVNLGTPVAEFDFAVDCSNPVGGVGLVTEFVPVGTVTQDTRCENGVYILDDLSNEQRNDGLIIQAAGNVVEIDVDGVGGLENADKLIFTNFFDSTSHLDVLGKINGAVSGVQTVEFDSVNNYFMLYAKGMRGNGEQFRIKSIKVYDTTN